MCLGEFFSTLFSFFSGMHRLGGGFLCSFILFKKKKVSAFWVSLEVKRTRSPSSDLGLGFCMSMLQQKGRELMWTLDSGLCLWCGFHVHPWGHGRAHGVQGNVRLARYMYKCIHVVSRFVRCICRVRSIWYRTLVSCDVRR